jgi:hypothetical protein
VAFSSPELIRSRVSWAWRQSDLSSFVMPSKRSSFEKCRARRFASGDAINPGFVAPDGNGQRRKRILVRPSLIRPDVSLIVGQAIGLRDRFASSCASAGLPGPGPGLSSMWRYSCPRKTASLSRGRGTGAVISKRDERI